MLNEFDKVKILNSINTIDLSVSKEIAQWKVIQGIFVLIQTKQKMISEVRVESI